MYQLLKQDPQWLLPFIISNAIGWSGSYAALTAASIAVELQANLKVLRPHVSSHMTVLFAHMVMMAREIGPRPRAYDSSIVWGWGCNYSLLCPHPCLEVGVWDARMRLLV